MQPGDSDHMAPDTGAAPTEPGSPDRPLPCERTRWRSLGAPWPCRTWVLALALAGPSAAVGGELPSLSVDRILEHLRVLGGDEMEGRGTGSPGGRRAARYLEARLTELDLEPMGGGGFRQDVPMHGSRPLRSSRLELVDPQGEHRSLELWDDYIIFDTTPSTLLPQPLPMFFVGYGIVAPEYDHNDYQQIDPQGGIVVFLAGEPPSSDSDYFAGEAPTEHSDPALKFRTALSRGARGALLLPSRREGAFTRWEDVLDAFQSEDVTLPYGVAGSLDLVLREDNAPLLFAGTTSWREVQRLDGLGELRSFPLAMRMRFDGAFRQRDFTAANLLARLRGSDPILSDEHVIVAAHYDALGVGRPHATAAAGSSRNAEDTIYNGVIDNASGTAVTLEIARVLAGAAVAPRRSILFLFVTGEEQGLLGSRYYRDHPVVPLHRTAAAINIDGIAFLDTTRAFVGIGSQYSTLGSLLEETLAPLGLRRGQVPAAFRHREPFYTSDQLAFAQAGIPSILVMESLDFENLEEREGLERFVRWGRERYHTPFDDLER
ncbi:MAG: M28 family peptidase, partial [Thermoanaerobaculia bacterium]|nr:M28 family peptidase [Thermoanaerobaculia bacterium]